MQRCQLLALSMLPPCLLEAEQPLLQLAMLRSQRSHLLARDVLHGRDILRSAKLPQTAAQLSQRLQGLPQRASRASALQRARAGSRAQGRPWHGNRVPLGHRAAAVAAWPGARLHPTERCHHHEQATMWWVGRSCGGSRRASHARPTLQPHGLLQQRLASALVLHQAPFLPHTQANVREGGDQSAMGCCEAAIAWPPAYHIGPRRRAGASECGFVAVQQVSAASCGARGAAWGWVGMCCDGRQRPQRPAIAQPPPPR